MTRHKAKILQSVRDPIVRWVGIAVLLLLVPATTGPQGLVVNPTPPPGGTATLLSDGRWLIVGGEDRRGPRADATIWDPRTQTSVTLPTGLDHARAWHTATELPDGRVLVFGGLGANGRVTVDAERFDPATEHFARVPALALTPRAQHTATLLTDGRILVAGGVVADGRTAATGEVWHPATGATERVRTSLTVARRGHTATLLPSGEVWIAGGVDEHGARVGATEVFDPITSDFTHATQGGPPGPHELPRLAGSIPENGDTGVPGDGVIALRFSKPLRADRLASASMLLSGPAGVEAARLIVAEGGRLLFVAPDATLQPASVYTVSISGAIDTNDLLLPPASVTFTTAGTVGGAGAGAEPRSSTQAGDEHDHHHGHGGLPPGHSPDEYTGPVELDRSEYEGERREGRPSSRWQQLPPLQAPPGVTALAGQVLKLNGQPLADVTLRIGARRTRSDRTGRFLLTDIPAGYPNLAMDGATASRPGRTYGSFEYGVHVTAGQTTALSWTIWLPLIDTAHAVRIPVPTSREMVVTTPRVPGLEMRIPAGVVLRTRDGQPLTWVTLTQLPVDRTPFPLPDGAAFFFTPQTHGAVVERADGTRSPVGVRFILPNVERLAPGVRVNLTAYDTTRRWHVYGQGTVRRDGRQILPDAEVEFVEVGCIMILGPTTAPPAVGPRPGPRVGDPVDPATGLFVLEKTDLVVPDVIPIVWTRTYRPLDGVRAFGPGASHPYNIFLVGDTAAYTFADLIQADGFKIRYTRISGGTGYTDAVMEHTTTPTGWYKSRLTWNTSRPGWDVTRTDGTVYEFNAPANWPGPMLTGIRDRRGHRLEVERAGPNTRRVARIRTPHGRWMAFTYDATDRVTQAKDHAGRVVTYEYDASGRLAAVVDAAGGRTEYTYNTQDLNGRMATLKDARGIVFLTNAYDAAGRVTQQTQADGTTWQLGYTLDVDGTIVQTDVTDPRGYVRRFTFSASGYVLTDTRAFGTALAQTTTYVRDSAHRVTSMTDALGRVTASTYDAMGNRLTVTRLAGTPDAVMTTSTYEATFNQVASVTDPLTHTTTFGYDGVGNLTTITNPLGEQTTVTYDALGRPLTATTAAGTTTLTYDGPDLSSTTDPTGRVTTQFADTLGRRMVVTSPAGPATRIDYDALNRVVKIKDALGGETLFGYDANGNLLSVTDARAGVTGYTYNNLDRLATRTDPLLRSESYGYDNDGNLTSVTDRKGQVTSRTYDALGRLSQVTFAGSSTITYTWDAGNRLTQRVDSIAGTITRTYDGLDRLTQETTPQGSVSYTYDAAGRRTSMTVMGQPPVTYGYDTADRLTSITQGSQTVTFAYDAAGRRTAQTFSSGITTEYAYDAAGRITGLTYKHDPNTLGTLTYDYDSNGSRHQVGGTWARTGLPAAVTSATYDAGNRQTTFNGQALTYDFNGNLTNDGATTYTWDVRNRLSGLTGPGGPAAFQYDAEGRRAGKTFNTTTTGVLHDGLNPTQETTGAVVRSILTGPGIDEYLSHASSSGESRTALADALGSTIALVDGTGQVVTEYTYEPFGATTATGAPSENRAKFTSRENDDTGLYSYRARYYHPVLQRFISEDPNRRNLLASNPYVYVDNNPVNLTDPLGLEPVSVLMTDRKPIPGVPGSRSVGDVYNQQGAFIGYLYTFDGKYILYLPGRGRGFTEQVTFGPNGMESVAPIDLGNNLPPASAWPPGDTGEGTKSPGDSMPPRGGGKSG